MVCLVDFSQLVIASVSAQAEDLKGGDGKSMVKHIALNQLLALKKRFKSNIILCCDSSTYWRKDIFPAYKGHRKFAKEKAKAKGGNFLDFDLVYESITELKSELAENFTYPVLEIYNAEADDIISCLCKYFSENEFISTGLFEEPQEIIICSTDKDFQQLQKYNNVQQWNNITKQMMVCANPKEFLIGHICIGDTGDNVPNICTESSWAEARSRGESVRAKSFFTIRESNFLKNGIDACVSETERNNYIRNEKLIDLDRIPDKIYSKIIDTYTKYEVTGNKSKVFNYLNSQRMKLLLASYSEF